jgi:hypothetical protein
MNLDLLYKFVVEQPAQDDISHLLGGDEQQAQQPQQGPQQSQDQQAPQQGEEDVGKLLGGEEQPESGEQGLDDMVDQAASQDPDKQGLIRQVDRAHLVFKRQTEDGTYEELWIYNVGKLQDELEIRKAVLAGTDIPTNKKISPDGTQTYDIWSAGNAELLHIKGLPN